VSFRGDIAPERNITANKNELPFPRHIPRVQHLARTTHDTTQCGAQHSLGLQRCCARQRRVRSHLQQ
jgi:hypothetical protein